MKQPITKPPQNDLNWLNRTSYADTFNHLGRTDDQPASSSSRTRRPSPARAGGPSISDLPIVSTSPSPARTPLGAPPLITHGSNSSRTSEKATQRRREKAREKLPSKKADQSTIVPNERILTEDYDVSSLAANSAFSTPAGTISGKKGRCELEAKFNGITNVFSEEIAHLTPNVRPTVRRNSSEIGGNPAIIRLLEPERRAMEAVQVLHGEAERATLEKQDEIDLLKKEMEQLKEQFKRLQSQVKELQEERQDLLLAKQTLAEKLWRDIEEKNRLEEPDTEVDSSTEEDESIIPSSLPLPEDVSPGLNILDLPPILVERDRLQGIVIAGSIVRGMRQRTTCEHVALKQMKKHNDPEFNEAFFREVRALQALHPMDSVLDLLPLSKRAPRCLVDNVTQGKETMSLWDLANHLVSLPQYRKGLTVSIVRLIAHELTLLVAKLHRLGWVHRDIKPPNILVTKHGRFILTDMGITGLEAEDFNFYCGTAGFTAPEVSTKKVARTDKAVDMWALGSTILWMMGTVRGTYAMDYGILIAGQQMDKDGKDNARSIDNLVGRAFPKKEQPEAYDFVRKCLRHRPSARLTVKQATDHPWISDLPRELPEKGPWLDKIAGRPKKPVLKNEDKVYQFELGRGPVRELLFVQRQEERRDES
ncbi:Dual specificity tyrosine-phosphorylation-regulated kinase 3 [Serendipita sp. 399]|nr:Dual specificity tyrosine-phosphorylation-regulated kinase 3 [Serendipita sp. 399]